MNMAEDEDDFSNKKLAKNLNEDENTDEIEQSPKRPDLGIEEAKYNSNENDDKPSSESPSSSSKSGGAIRKEDNPFSFRHFLKRDLSLPGSSTYEHTGARPKVYASTVQHSPSRADSLEPRREKTRSADSQPRASSREGSAHRLSDHTASSSSVEVPFSLVEDSESKRNLYTDNEAPFYHRPNLASEPLGMPSLPDFVQDHILVEQAYLNSNGPISVDLDNLPDFTFNTNYNSSSWRRRNNSGYSGKNYDYDPFVRGASTSDGLGPSDRNIPLDLPVGAEAAGLPLDLPPHLNLDLTESVNPADRRNNSPRNTFPLDLPSHAGAEAMRLPDFLPVHPGRTSPELDHHDEQMAQVLAELERTRTELLTERARRSRLESEAAAAAAALRGSDGDDDARSPETESTVIKLRNQIKKLKEELAASRAEARSLRGAQAAAARDLRSASRVAEVSLRELLAGLDQLKSLSSTLDPT